MSGRTLKGAASGGLAARMVECPTRSCSRAKGLAAWPAGWPCHTGVSGSYAAP